jgi:hypothetical protein
MQIQFVPSTKHVTSPLKRSAGYCLAKQLAIYCENHTKHTNVLCGHSAEFKYVKAGGTYRTTGVNG